MKCYLAGAMACYGDDLEMSRQWRREVENYCSKHYDYIQFVNPTKYYEYTDKDVRASETMRFDLRKVRESDLILVNLKDLDRSIGTSDEILYAFTRGTAIVGFLETDKMLNRNELEQVVHGWKIEQIDRIETGPNAMKKAIDYIGYYYAGKDLK